VTCLLITCCLLMALEQKIATTRPPDLLVRCFAVVPLWFLSSEVRPASYDVIPIWLTPLTGIFIPDGVVLHSVLGLAWLALFGTRVEGAVGPLRYVALLVAGAYATAVFEALALPTLSAIAGVSGISMVVLGASMVIRPKQLYRVQWIPGSPWLVPTPAIAVAIAALFIDLCATVDDMRLTQAANLAQAGHWSGLPFGMALVTILRSRNLSPAYDDMNWSNYSEFEDAFERANATRIEALGRSKDRWRDRRFANRWLAAGLLLILATAAAVVFSAFFHL
jgi:membrane associated rhomboid family serine protease